MRRLLLISLATIPLTGCQFFNRGSDPAVVDPLDPASVGEAISSLPNGDAAADADSEAFSDLESPEASVSADLIQSTDANARALQVQRSRNDPFASLPIPPPPEPAELPDGAAGSRRAAAGDSGAASAGSGGGATRSAGNASGGSSGRSSGRASNGGRTAATSNGAGAAVAARPTPTPPPVRVQPANEPLVNPSPIAALPPVPQPVIAQTVSVSGVIQLGNEPYAILRSGSEPERYVKVGDRIAGGSVRVKRIETLAFEPSVILEENGIEVARPITASSTAGSDAESPAVPVNAPSVPVPPVPVPGEQAGSQLGNRVSQARSQASNQTLIPGLPVVPVPGAGASQPTPGAVPRSLTLLPS